MPATWIDWPHDECPICGSGVKILTSCPQELPADEMPEGQSPPWCYSDDRWRCGQGHEGGVYCDSETPVQLEGGDEL